MRGILDAAEKKRLQDDAAKRGEAFDAEVEAELEKERKELRNEIRDLVNRFNVDKWQFVAELESRYNTRDLKQLTREQLTDTLERLRGRAAQEALELEQIDREAKEVAGEKELAWVSVTRNELQQGSPDTRAHVVGGAVVPILTEEQAIEHFQRFQHLKSAVLTDADYMFVGKDGKPCKKEEHVAEYIKKSGWRKIALMFNISVRVWFRERIEGEDGAGKWHGWLYKVSAIAPNGRFQEAEGSCTTRNSFFCKRWDEAKGAYKWVDTDEKNLICTAQTVAINRAISDLVGSGELSAEEVVE